MALDIYSNEVVKTAFCKEKTCLICNSIRLAKFLDKYLDKIKEENYLYHMVLTVQNPDANKLKRTIEMMFNFFKNSSIKKDNTFRILNKRIKFIRSFEATFNEKNKTYHIHFHILLAGSNEIEIKEYGEIIINYWMKYFRKKVKVNRAAQYFEPQERSVLENFKYLFKIKDISDSNLGMVYNLLKAIEGKRLFLAKNIKLDKILDDEMKELKFNDIDNESLINTYNYSKEFKNWIDENTGELFVQEGDFEKLKKDNIEKRNYRKINFTCQ